MNKEAKTLKNFTYYGLGFPVKLPKVEVVVLDGEQYFLIDIEKLKTNFLSMIISDKQKSFSGGMLIFIRGYLGLSKQEFADVLNVNYFDVCDYEELPEQVVSLSENSRHVIKKMIRNKINN